MNLHDPDQFETGRKNGLERKKKRISPMEIILIIVLVWAVLATLCIVFLVLLTPLGIDHETNTNVATEAVVEIVPEVQNEDEIRAAVKAELLADLKEKMLSGEGAVAMLRDYFPDEIVYLSAGEYRFFPILESLKKHPYADLTLTVDETTGQFMTYQDDMEVAKFGIDVSYHQGEIDWELVREEGVNFAIIRLGFRGYESGKLVIDEKYLENIAGANAAGIDAGVYFYTQAISVEEAVEEADYVIENLEGYELSMPIVFDIERPSASSFRTQDLSMQEFTDLTIAFCERVREAGYEPMIYGNMISFTTMLDLTRLEDYPKWFAHYDESMYYPYDYDIWQYSDTGKLEGVEESVDFNLMFEKDMIQTINVQ